MRDAQGCNSNAVDLPLNIYVVNMRLAKRTASPVPLYFKVMATFVHPNELFDGAVTVDTTRSGRGYYPTTWDWQNHPLVLELYAAHGKRLNFAGVVLQRIRFETSHGKEVGAQNAALLAKAMTTISTLRPSCWKNPCSRAIKNGIAVMVTDGKPILMFSA